MLAISFGEVRLVSIVSPSCTPVLGKMVCTRGRSGTARRCRHQIAAVLDLAEDTIFALSPSWLGGATGDMESAGAEWEVGKAGGRGCNQTAVKWEEKREQLRCEPTTASLGCGGNCRPRIRVDQAHNLPLEDSISSPRAAAARPNVE
jgi:hypothetical protein